MPLLFSVVCFLVAMFISLTVVKQEAQASTNSLKVGPLASMPDGSALTLNRTQHFNYLSREEVLKHRTNAVMAVPSLVNAPYTPTSAVFDEIVDGKPWWGMAGQYIWGEGQRSIEGPSEESRFILNPYLLVAANPWTAKIWNQEQITEEDLNNQDFPYTWTPQELRYWPSRKMAQAIYDVTAFNGKLKAVSSKLETTEPNYRFGLVAYNARDFGYGFLFISPQQSTNIENSFRGNFPIEIKQYIHSGDSSKYPGGCNNMSPAMDEIDKLTIKQLPARAVVYLWKTRPPLSTAPADFTFVLDFK